MKSAALRLAISGQPQRIGLLALVIAAHTGLLLMIDAARNAVPRPFEQTIEVALLLPQPRTEPPPSARKPQTVKAPASTPAPAKRPRAATRRPSAPAIEASESATAPTAAVPAVPAVSADAPADAPAGAATSAPPSGAGQNGQGKAHDAISQARFDADYLKNPPPPYPPQARRMGDEGRVILRVQVSAEGRAQNVEIKTSSGSTRLDESAQRTVRGWRFIPAQNGQTPVDSWVLVPIIFRLEQ